MAKTELDVAISPTWSDLTATYAELASTSAYVQNKDQGEILVAFTASASQPVGAIGLILKRAETVSGTAAHIWVKSVGAGGLVGCGLTD